MPDRGVEYARYSRRHDDRLRAPQSPWRPQAAAHAEPAAGSRGRRVIFRAVQSAAGSQGTSWHGLLCKSSEGEPASRLPLGLWNPLVSQVIRRGLRMPADLGNPPVYSAAASVIGRTDT